MGPILLAVLACAPGKGVEVTPEAWRQGLTAARPADHDVWLRRLHLPVVTGAAWTAVKLESVELLPAHLSGAKTPELIARAIFVAKLKAEREPLDPEVRLYRVQVLQQEGARWCAISAALSEDVTVESPNPGPADGMKDTRSETRLAAVRFSHADRDSIEVRKPFDNVSRVRVKGEAIEYWDLVNGGLRQLLATSSETEDCAPCDVRYRKTWLELRGSAPKVVFRFTRRCAGEGETSCEPVTEERYGPFWLTAP